MASVTQNTIYFRVAGETRGRGPITLALPSIKTVNKAQELALKSAAIQMLGIWGYRANSGFNPDTAAQQPGSFWAMQSTGGILGPDVTRLDPAAGRELLGLAEELECRQRGSTVQDLGHHQNVHHSPKTLESS